MPAGNENDQQQIVSKRCKQKRGVRHAEQKGSCGTEVQKDLKKVPQDLYLVQSGTHAATQAANMYQERRAPALEILPEEASSSGW
jgi:hypothetical protein